MAKFRFTYKTVVKLAVSTLIFILLNGVHPLSFLSVPMYLALLYLGFNVFLSAICLTLGFICNFSVLNLFLTVITAVLTLPIFAFLKKKKIKVGAKILPISILAVLPFILTASKENFIIILIEAVSCVILTPLFISSARVIFIKNFNYKCGNDELTCLAVFTIALGIGFIKLFGFNAYISAVIFIVLCSSFIFYGGTATAISIILSFAPTILSLDFSYFASFTCLALSTCLFTNKSRFLSALSSIACYLVFSWGLKIYGAFYYLDVLYSIVPACIFLFLPSKLFSSLKRKRESLDEKLLSRYAINRTRIAISGKLYELAGAFSEMKRGFEELKRQNVIGEDAYSRMADEIVINVCDSCPSFERCKQKNMPEQSELIKIISVGVAKGRVSLIDLTKKFVENCGYVNSIICEVNELIARYKQKVKETDEITSGKELITMQASGTAGVLKNLALDFSKNLSFDLELEKKLGDGLHKNGVIYKEIMAFDGDGDVEIYLSLNVSEFNAQAIENAVSTILQRKMSIVSKKPLSITVCIINLRPAPTLDASFGLASQKKHNSIQSGDTHSLIKINEGSFMVCLSDGMGSGKEANKTSSTAISLIESFYKAGIDGNCVLSVVNKVLSMGTDESFSAMDVLTINLFNMRCDFIKIGSPSSYLISNSSIRIIDGNSLPLGILDDLKPCTISFPVSEGDLLLMISDGVSDAFGSSTDLITFLKGLKSLNPQKLADDVINQALSLDNGTPKDDMTAVCVRIFKKAS